MPRINQLSNDPRNIKDRYGVIVVGSGYGGSITAAPLAAAGHAVCLLERGKEWIPGSFPDELGEVIKEIRTQRNPLGLYDYLVGDDQDVLVGNGLGGTSLINANVVIRPDTELFQSERWPQALREAAAKGELDPHMTRVIAMQRATSEGARCGMAA